MRTLQRLAKDVQRARLIGGAIDGKRHKDDFYATPAPATHALLDAESFEGSIWEPACGDGAISKVLAARGHDTTSTDLVDRGYRFGQHGVDFLMETKPLARNIVTNPPFKLANEFVRKALDLTTGKVAMLLKVGFLEGKGRADIHEKLSRVWVFRARQTFLRGGSEAIKMNGAGGMIAYGWFVWEHGHEGPPTLGWI